MNKESKTVADDTTRLQMKAASVAGSIALIALAGPFALLFAPAFYAFTKKMGENDAGKEIDQATGDDADEIAQTWKANRLHGESRVTVEHHPLAGPGAGFRRIHTYTSDEE
jgi:hypothetical protein